MEKSENIKNQLLKSALKEFAQNGYDKASLTNIAVNVGSSKGAIYWYFKNKVDLFGQTLIAEFVEYDEYLKQRIANSDSSIETLKLIYFHSAQYFLQNRNYCHLLFLAMSNKLPKGEEKVSVFLMNTEEQYFNFLLDIVRDGLKSNELRINEPYHIVISFGIMLDGIIMQILLNQPESEIRKGLDFSWKIFSDGIAQKDWGKF